MTTAIDIISRAMRLLGVYSIGETPSSEESNDGLAALNSMLDSWAVQSLFVYAETLDAITLAASVSSITVGPSGTTITARPVTVLGSSYIDYQGVSYPLAIDTLTDYNNIPSKTQIVGIPSQIYALNNMPNITVFMWPVPFATMTLNLWSNKLIQSFASLTDTLTLPPGYERALVFSLAEEIAPEYQLEPSRDVVMKAAYARKVIKRVNTEVPRLQMPYGVPVGNSFSGNYRLG